jgi:hypothetical protein
VPEHLLDHFMWIADQQRAFRTSLRVVLVVSNLEQ